MANSWDNTCYWRSALKGGIGVYMRVVWCHERNAHAFGSRRNALVEYYTPEHAVKVTVTVSSHEVKWPIVGTLHATGGVH
jgi:hypothetical protein